jgi:peptidoglycan/xylan/chitin deacetylase (PgdA/CDA1 family)
VRILVLVLFSMGCAPDKLGSGGAGNSNPTRDTDTLVQLDTGDTAGVSTGGSSTGTNTGSSTGTNTGSSTGTNTGSSTGTTTGTTTGSTTGSSGGTTSTSPVTVTLNWTGSTPTSGLDVTINDPLGRTGWDFGIAETEAGTGGWYGEDCWTGTGGWQYCHPMAGNTLHLDQVPTVGDIIEGSTTLLWSGMNLTYYVANGGDCYVWGHDTSYFAPLGCTGINGSLGSSVVRRGGCSGMDPADPVGNMGGKVALTFDDGPHITVTPQILATLRYHNVPATFFMLGDNAADPAVWPIIDDIDQDPLFTIANHSWYHPDFTTLTASEIDAEIDDTHQLLSTWTAPTFFRFPYGNSTCDSADTARFTYGQKVAGWHADTADWCYATGTVGSCNQSSYWRIPIGYENDMIGFTLDQLLAFDGGVLLLHDIHQYTADSLDTLILTLQANGLTFASLDDATALPLLNANTPYDFPWMGEACDTNNDTCWQVEWNSWCEPSGDPGLPATAGICVLPCTDWCVDRDGVAPLHCAEALPNEGHCLSQSTAINNYCADVDGAIVDNLPEWDNGTPWADVCVPYGW